jgi:muconolactone delta-isomerase
MQFLVEVEVDVPGGARGARLVDEGQLLRLWRRNASADGRTVIIPLASHPNDPAAVAR